MPRPLHRSTPALLLCLACHHAGAPGGDPVDTGTGTGPAPTTAPASPTTGPASPTSTASTSTTSTSADATSTSTDATSAPGSTSDTTAAAPSCGDGHLDPGEACDDGLGNGDHAACTLACQPASCGDGKLWQGHEACDLGPDNNDALYGGCTTQCQLGDHCGDGAVQGPEECDLAGDEPPDGGVPCTGCRFAARLAFVTDELYKGGELGGVEGAHLKCRNLALQQQFDNAASFKAWLSDAQRSPAQDFDHGPDTLGLPYVLPSGVRLADDWNDLTQNGPRVGLTVSQSGAVVLDWRVWTNTAPSGLPFDLAAHCKSWSSSAPVDSARTGRSGVPEQPVDEWNQWADDRQWTNYTTIPCDFLARLYCFEQ
jgi:hypothetical protein